MCVQGIEFHLNFKDGLCRGITVIVHDVYTNERKFFIDERSGAQELLDHVAAEAINAVKKDFEVHFAPGTAMHLEELPF